MSTVVTARGVTKRYAQSTALDDVSFSIREHTIYGLLGRNGAGKTTLMQILTGQGFATSGQVEVFGAAPYENDAVLSDVCFVKESQRYPDSFTVRHALRAAGLLFPNWDEQFAQSLVDDFGLPRKRRVKKMSRGMISALGVIIGLASRSRLTLFDEPYLGLDAVARHLFYDRLLADYSANPRTVILSTHLIDEVGDLIEHVLLLDKGRLVVDEDAETLRGQAVTLTGPAAAVDKLASSSHLAQYTELHRDQMGATTRVTLRGRLDAAERARAGALGLDVAPVSLQQLVVHLTGSTAGTATKEASR
jgi:ABC-2 type transport system ATP-binding protein